MCANDEMRVYLEELVDHERTCEVNNCSLCQAAQNIYSVVRNLIFSAVDYPHITIAGHTSNAVAGGAWHCANP